MDDKDAHTVIPEVQTEDSFVEPLSKDDSSISSKSQKDIVSDAGENIL